MEQLEKLWEYQMADMEYDKCKNELRRSPQRQKLLKLREQMLEQKTQVEQMNDHIALMADRIDALQDAVLLCADQAKSLEGKAAADLEAKLESVSAQLNDLKRIQANLASYEREIKSIRDNTSEKQKLQLDARKRFARLKNEYESLKTTYDEAVKESNEKLDSLKEAVNQKANGIDPELLNKYKSIKLHSDPPLARLSGNQCGGCNMSLPSAVIRDVRGGALVECENCGRLLLPPIGT